MLAMRVGTIGEMIGERYVVECTEYLAFGHCRALTVEINILLNSSTQRWERRTSSSLAKTDILAHPTQAGTYE